MPNLNAVTVVLADLYVGEDQAVYYTPAAGDDSGIPVAEWTVEVRLWEGRIALGSTAPAAARVEATEYAAPKFVGVVPSSFTSTMTPGPWSMEVWRTNAGAAKLLLRVQLTVYPTIRPEA